MNEDLRRAIREWDSEISSVATELIENGTPPYEAIDKAKEIVQRQRRRRNQKEMNNYWPGKGCERNVRCSLRN